MIGRQLLQAVIRDNAPSRLSLFHDDYFTEEELPLFEFVRNHKARYGVLPTDEVLSGAGHTLRPLRGDQPLEYYEERLRNRFVYNVASDKLANITAAMQSQDAGALRQLFSEAVTDMNSASGGDGVTTYEAEVQKVLQEYQVAKQTRGRLRGVTLGWDCFDAITMGAMPGDLIVYAGRPGVAKTTVMSKVICAGRARGTNGLILTMEMSREAITRRLVGIETGINPNMIRSGELSLWAERQLAEYARNVSQRGRLLIESGESTGNVDHLGEAVQRFAPDALYIDAAYLMSALPPSVRRRGGASKWEELSEVIGKLKQLAMKQHIPVFITVQFNRNQKDNSKKAMDLSDIGGTDSIPQDASIVFGIRRAEEPHDKTRREIVMLKNREGDVTKATINFLFEPVNLEEINVEDEQQAQRQENQYDAGWMG